MAVAFFLSGLVISRFQPRAWVLAVYDVMVGLVFVGGLLFFAFWGCNTKAIQGVNQIGGQYQYAPPPPITFTTRSDLIDLAGFATGSTSTPTATQRATVRRIDSHPSVRPTVKPTTFRPATADVTL